LDLKQLQEFVANNKSNIVMLLICLAIFVFIVIMLLKKIAERKIMISNLSGECYLLVTQLGSAKKKSGVFFTYNELDEVVYDYCDKFENDVKYYLNSFTAVGLLFTFVGLTFSVGNMSGVLDGLKNAKEIGEVISQIKPVLGNMGLAFASSLLGLVLSLVFGFLNNAKRNKEDKMITDFLNNSKINLLPSFAPATSQFQIENYFNKFQENISLFFDRFIENQKSSLAQYAESVNTQSNVVHELYSETFKSFGAALRNLEKNMTTDNKNFEQASQLISTASKEITSSMKNISNKVDLFAQKVDKVNNFTKPLEDTTQKFDEFLNSVDSLISAINTTADNNQLKNIHTQLEAINALAANTKDVLVQNSATYEKITQSIKEHSINSDKMFKDSAEFMQKNLNVAHKMIENNHKLAENMITEIKQMKTMKPELPPKVLNDIAKIEKTVSIFDAKLKTMDSDLKKELSELRSDLKPEDDKKPWYKSMFSKKETKKESVDEEK